YIVSDKNLTVPELREYLLKGLPEYMIPSYYIQLEKMPLTPNAKIDRKALPEPGGSINTGEEYVAPVTWIEKKLAGIWQEVLGVEKVGINDNFFELGGNSIKIMLIISKIYEQTGVESSLKQVFENPTIQKLCELFTWEEFISLGKIEAILLNKLNSKNGNKIFAFSPPGGDAKYYNELAKDIDLFSFYGFSFLYPKDYIQAWTDIIINLQDGEPCILLGQSAGGNLAFEVAKELIQSDQKVSDIILLDTSIGMTMRIYNERGGKENFIKNIIKIAERGLNQKNFNENDEKESQIDFENRHDDNNDININGEKYSDVKKVVDIGKIDSNIHFIKCEYDLNPDVQLMINTKADDEKIKFLAWHNEMMEENIQLLKKCTTGLFKQYTGYGSHLDMVNPPYLEKNVAIINEILKNIG
ncbi:MAG: hypothetical protein FIA99_18895, partial [Ruminiclostridium sp.]|nr:hypothetical protein [Ruminiclostridium sp.]